VKKQYPLTSHRNELTRIYFEFDTNETEITLSPEDSTSSRKDPEDWMQKSDEIHVAASNQGEVGMQTTDWLRFIFSLCPTLLLGTMNYSYHTKQNKVHSQLRLFEYPK